MRENKFKLMALLLTMCMVMTFTPLQACAAASTYSTANATLVEFSSSGITAEGKYSGYEISDTTFKITAAGTFVFSGECRDGNIEVSKGLSGVNLVLDGLTLTSSATAPINAKSESDVKIVLADGSVNSLTDADRAEEKPKAVINSNGTLTMSGTGTLNITAKNKNGIKCDYDLTIESGNYNITAVDNGIVADNLLTVNGGSFDITADGAGIKTSPDEVNDEFKAELTVNDGQFNINTTGDAIHSDAEAYITGGDFTINSKDDGIHAETKLTIGEKNGKDENLNINVQSSYEGLEGESVYIYSGNINVVSSDDGINAAGGSSDMFMQDGQMVTVPDGKRGDLTSGGGIAGEFTSGGAFHDKPFGGVTSGGAYMDRTSGGGFAGGGMNGGMEAAGDYNIYIYGGNTKVSAQGDGIDANSNLYIYDGIVDVNQSGNNNAALDYGGACEIYGGSVFASGSNGMVATPTKGTDTLAYVMFSQNSSIASGTEVAVKDSSGKTIYSTKLTQPAGNVIYASEDIIEGSSYTLEVSGADAATAVATTETGSMGMGGGMGMRPGNGFNTTQGGINGFDGSQPGMSEIVSETKFTDVSSNDWFASSVNYVTQRGLMDGISETEFSPSSNMTRAMLVTVLWRLENQPAAGASTNFEDVESGSWYSSAVSWAYNNNIVTGYSANSFHPSDSVTREQIAAILQRYASYKGLNTETSYSLSAYNDLKNVSDWAESAMQWAVSTGIISGRTENTLVPAGSATRAEVATMLMRYESAARI